MRCPYGTQKPAQSFLDTNLVPVKAVVEYGTVRYGTERRTYRTHGRRNRLFVDRRRGTLGVEPARGRRWPRVDARRWREARRRRLVDGTKKMRSIDGCKDAREMRRSAGRRWRESPTRSLRKIDPLRPNELKSESIVKNGRDRYETRNANPDRDANADETQQASTQKIAPSALLSDRTVSTRRVWNTYWKLGRWTMCDVRCGKRITT